jgi:RHS repeat-associated protein
LMKFTGHERDVLGNDPHTLDDMHARYYSPTVGRFLSVDPVLGNPQAPQSWNRYAYVMNNPMNRTDPTGKYTCDGSKANCDVVNKMIAFLPQAAAQLSKNDPHRQQLLAVSKAFGKLGDTKSKIGVVTVNPVDAKGRQQLPPGVYGAPTTTGVAISFLNIGAQAHGNNQLAIEMVGGDLTHEATHKLQNLSSPIRSRAEHVGQERQAYDAEAGWFAGTAFNAPNGTWTSAGGYNQQAINQAAEASTAAACGTQCPP